MKKTFLLIALFIFPLIFLCAHVQIQTDLRYETLGVACRLAGFSETQVTQTPEYGQAVDSYFEVYQNHPFVVYLKEMSQKNPDSFQVLLDATSLLTVSHSKIRVSKNKKELIQKFEKEHPNFLVKEWAKKMHRFYRQTRFERFYKQQQSFYTTKLNKLQSIYAEKLDTTYFHQVFAHCVDECPIIYSSLIDQQYFPLHYECSPTILKGTFGKYDSPNSLSLVSATIRGFASVYVQGYPLDHFNSVMHQWEDKLVSKYPESALSSTSYKTLDCLLDWCLILYNHSSEKSQLLMQKANVKSYVWQERMYDYIDSQNHDNLTYIEMIPQLEAYFTWCETQSSLILDEFNHRNPYVVSVYPTPGMPLDLSKDMIYFTITFSKDMLPTRGKGLLCKDHSQLKRESVKGISAEQWKNPMYSILGTRWLDARTCVIEVEGEEARKAGLYGFVLPMNMYSDRFGNTFTQDFKMSY
jgi:hypothetical protein